MLRVAIVGAGAAGLASARHVTEAGFQCEVFEIKSNLGGVWLYTNEVDCDQFGFPVYSAMYEGLRTNLPKEVMGFPDFPIPDREASYLTQAEILEFLNLYADNFNLRPLMKFNRMVSDIRPLTGNGNNSSSNATDQWQVTSIDKHTKTEHVDQFDAIIICNGHYNEPVLPKIQGQEQFAGTIYHSCQYRSPTVFQDQRVLLIGAGPSGIDLALHISRVAKQVVLSHHSQQMSKNVHSASVMQKPDVVRIVNEEDVEFQDGTTQGFDTIVLCTGYKYGFPFLHQSCNVQVDDYQIQPLYKHMVHIEKPTMCFIGIPFNVCAFQMFDLQARVFCEFLKTPQLLPTTKEMFADTEADMKARQQRGCTKRQAHMMGDIQQDYYLDLASTGQTTPIAPVIVKLRDLSVELLYKDLMNFRKNRYRILDNDTFEMIQG